MKKLYKCNRCGLQANLDFDGQSAGLIEAITLCADRNCGGTLVLSESIPGKAMELVL
jgi:hypothetical protein